MHTYAAVDLHSNNGFLVIIDERDRVLRQRKLANNLELFVNELEPYRSTLQGVAVESTFNCIGSSTGCKGKTSLLFWSTHPRSSSTPDSSTPTTSTTHDGSRT
jgi:hypothetical protein